MSTVTEEDVLTGLDFAPVFPCEHQAHRRKHEPNDPARYITVFMCPACPFQRKIMLCQSGYNRMQLPAMLGCRMCGQTGYWPDFVVSCEVI